MAWKPAWSPACDPVRTQMTRSRQRYGKAVVGQPFDLRWRRTVPPKSRLDRLHHRVAHQPGVNAVCGCHPAYYFPMAAIQRKGYRYPFAIVASHFKAIRAPAGIAAADGYLAIVPAGRDRSLNMTIEQQAMVPMTRWTRLWSGSCPVALGCRCRNTPQTRR